MAKLQSHLSGVQTEGAIPSPHRQRHLSGGAPVSVSENRSASRGIAPRDLRNLAIPEGQIAQPKPTISLSAADASINPDSPEKEMGNSV